MDTKDLDIVYIVRRGDVNHELKYSIRSIAKNMPHRNVWIFGNKPAFLSGKVKHHFVPQNKSPMQNTVDLIFEASRHPEVSGNFILMHDDFFVMDELDTLEHKIRGTYDEVISKYSEVRRRSMYVRRMIETKEYLKKVGIENPLCYELHMPFIINKANFIKLQTVNRFERYNKLSVYGNMYLNGGEKMRDVKVSTGDRVPDKFISTIEITFFRLPAGKKIINTFNKPCKYEKEWKHD